LGLQRGERGERAKRVKKTVRMTSPRSLTLGKRKIEGATTYRTTLGGKKGTSIVTTSLVRKISKKIGEKWCRMTKNLNEESRMLEKRVRVFNQDGETYDDGGSLCFGSARHLRYFLNEGRPTRNAIFSKNKKKTEQNLHT